MKKVRGSFKRRKYNVKVHSVTSTDFVMSTSFAMYRIPRSFVPFFVKANQHELQNVVCVSSYLNDVEFLSFYWFALDVLQDDIDFEKFKIKDK